MNCPACGQTEEIYIIATMMVTWHLHPLMDNAIGSPTRHSILGHQAILHANGIHQPTTIPPNPICWCGQCNHRWNADAEGYEIEFGSTFVDLKIDRTRWDRRTNDPASYPEDT